MPAVPFSPAFPYAVSITLAGSSPISNSGSFTVTFNQNVVGVDAADFQIVNTGSVANGTISSVSGSGTTYTVNVTGITGSGTLGLNLVDAPSISASPSFGNPSNFSTGLGSLSVTMGDINGDGKLDIVTANHGSNTTSVLLGSGNGAFGPKTDFATGTIPRSVSLGDVNGDGKLDIITANEKYSTSSVLLNTTASGATTPSFSNQSTFPTGTNPYSVTLGDVDGDGKLDIVTANKGANTASVLLGNGDGTFKGQTTFVTGNEPFSVTLGDVNGDDKLDIITANQA
ncbi:MAG: FG-GAP repeat domain-containing protein, partial [Planctomycetia bacterium]